MLSPRILVTLGLIASIIAGGCTSEPEPTPQTSEQEPQQLPAAEIDLGSFQFRAFDPTSNVQTQFDFELAAQVAGDQMSSAKKQVESHRIRIRDCVMVVSRQSTTDELEDPELQVFRRRLRNELNRVLAEPQIQEIYVSRFRVKTR